MDQQQTPMSSKEVKQQIVDAYKIQVQLEELTAELESKKKTIMGYFNQNPGILKDKRIEVEGKSKKLVALFVESVRLEFIPTKMQEKFRKEVFDECVIRKYYVTNISEFIKMLKLYGVPKNDFMKHIEVDYKVKSEVVKDLYSKGDITGGELKDTFTAKITKRIDIKTIVKKNE